MLVMDLQGVLMGNLTRELERGNYTINLPLSTKHKKNKSKKLLVWTVN